VLANSELRLLRWNDSRSWLFKNYEVSRHYKLFMWPFDSCSSSSGVPISNIGGNSINTDQTKWSNNDVLTLVEFFLSNGGGLNARDEHGETLLHKAAGRAHRELVEKLLNRGADVNVRDNFGRTPLHGHPWLSCDKDVVALLLDRGAEMGARDNDGLTALHLAAHGYKTEVVELLLSKGADVNAKSDSGQTPLHHAVEYCSEEMIELLLSKGADINATDNDNATPLRKAVQMLRNEPEGSLEAIEFEIIVELLRGRGGRE